MVEFLIDCIPDRFKIAFGSPKSNVPGIYSKRFSDRSNMNVLVKNSRETKLRML